MILTLYKNCKLNNSYKNVFAFGTYNQSTPLQLYLDSLQKYTINVDYVYQTKKGIINFDLYDNSYGDIYEYNYLRITDGAQFVRYCFIDSIDYNNGIVKLSYIEDVWHSYGASMKITKSFLSRNRLCNEEGFYTNKLKCLPIEYASNNELSIYSYNDENETYNMFVELQVYKGTKVGEVNSRTISVVQISCFDDMENPTTNIFDMSIEQIVKTSINLISCQGGKSTIFAPASPDYYVNIGDIIVVPSSWGLGNHFEKQSTSALYTGYLLFRIPDDSIFPPFNADFAQGWKPLPLSKNKKIDLYYKNITSNPHMKSIGTFSTQIETTYNGLNHTLGIKCFITDTDLKLYMSVDSNFIEITNDFKYELPFESITGEENNSLKLNRVLTNIVRTTSIIGTISSLGASYSGINELINANKFTPKGNITTSTRKLNSIVRLEERQNALIKDGIIDNSSDLLALIKNNAPNYSSTRYSVSSNRGIENALYGICTYSYLTDTYFENYMNKVIANTGYRVFEIIDDFEITGIFKPITTNMFNSLKYNFIKFEDVNVYGNFPRDIAQMLESILLSGTKVWFNYQDIN